MIPLVRCSACGFPFDSLSWELRHSGEVHESCCGEWECRKAPDIFTPGRICDFLDSGLAHLLPSDWQARLWKEGYSLGGAA